MKITKIKNLLVTAIITTSLIGGTIYSCINSSTDKVSLLNRAVRDNQVDKLKATRSDISIIAGSYHFAAIMDNQLYTWGQNQYGQLGIGDTSNKSIPTKVNGINGTITQVSLGQFHSGAIIDGKLYMWGHNNKGQLGTGNETQLDIPTEVTINGSITKLALGGNSSGVISNGKILMWGDNAYGELLTGDTLSKNIPTMATNVPSGTITDLVMGTYGAFGAIIDGKLYMWGNNSDGQLGTGDETDKTTPTEVAGLTGTISKITIGAYHTGAIVNNKLYVWGSNYFGELGTANSTPSSAPTELTSITGTISDISFGYFFSTAVIDNQVYTWGYNDQGQLGIGNKDDRNIPIKGILTGYATQIVVGESSVIAFINGQLYAWGSNFAGQLGIGNTVNKDIPTLINILPVSPITPDNNWIWISIVITLALIILIVIIILIVQSKKEKNLAKLGEDNEIDEGPNNYSTNPINETPQTNSKNAKKIIATAAVMATAATTASVIANKVLEKNSKETKKQRLSKSKKDEVVAKSKNETSDKFDNYFDLDDDEFNNIPKDPVNTYYVTIRVKDNKKDGWEIRKGDTLKVISVVSTKAQAKTKVKELAKLSNASVFIYHDDGTVDEAYKID